ncbi:MAG TPA: ATP-binding cassette domain-containing protein [Pseudonocardiaceae bacterium]|nr:ATP-binding cassette domain-containing protein [Pseudonocardiaceae bacterium]
MGENLIETHGLTKRYDEHLAVDQLELTVRRGEIYGFLGPNGAGKTTTLRILLGLVRPTSGTVRVLDAEPGDPHALARIGMLVESAAFYPYLSGRDNLRTFARYGKVPDTRVEEVLAIVSLTDRGGDKFATYSLGMKQRLGLACALLKDPELLILDEPTNGLDPAGITDMRRLIRKLGRDGHTVVLSSHLLGEVQQICDRVGMIARGRLLREGTVEELRGSATLEVTAEPLDKARELVEQVLGADRIATSGTALRLRAEPADAVRINRELVLAGIAVSSLSWTERSLEEIFFEVTDDPQPELTVVKDGV